MPPVLSRPTTTIISPPSSPKSIRNRSYSSPADRLTRGCTGRNTVGRVKKGKVELEYNDYYNIIIHRLSELTKKDQAGANRLISLDNLNTASKELLCKECVVTAVEEDRKNTIDVIAKYLTSKQDESNYEKEGLIHKLTTILNKNGDRRMKKILETSQVHTNDSIVGLGSHTTMGCCHNHEHTISPRSTFKFNSRKRTFNDFDVKLKSIILG